MKTKMIEEFLDFIGNFKDVDEIVEHFTTKYPMLTKEQIYRAVLYLLRKKLVKLLVIENGYFVKTIQGGDNDEKTV